MFTAIAKTTHAAERSISNAGPKTTGHKALAFYANLTLRGIVNPSSKKQPPIVLESWVAECLSIP
jgi:hypothetical protein